MEDTELTTYVVTVRTPNGTFDVELKTHLGPDAAARRAKYALFMNSQTGTPDDYVVAMICEGEFA